MDANARGAADPDLATLRANFSLVSQLLINQIQQWFARQVAAQVFLQQFGLPWPESVAGSAEVRSDQKVGGPPKRMAFRNGLRVGHVEGGGRDGSGLQRLDESRR